MCVGATFPNRFEEGSCVSPLPKLEYAEAHVSRPPSVCTKPGPKPRGPFYMSVVIFAVSRLDAE